MKKILSIIAAGLLFVSLIGAAAFYAPPTISVFTPTGYASLTAAAASANSALATTGASTPIATTVVITNTGATNIAYVLLGTAGVAVSATTGMPVTPGRSVTLAVRGATYIAGISASGTTLSIVTGY